MKFINKIKTFILSHQNRFNFFIDDIAADLKLFIFLLLVLSLYRALFIAVFASSLEAGTTFKDILAAMFFGFRISLKTAAAFIIPTFVFATLGRQIWQKWPSLKIRLWLGGAEMLVLSILFQTRIPYYREFHNAFDPFIFNTFHDDVYAITDTAIKQYNAPLRIFAGILAAAALTFLLKKFLSAVPKPSFAAKIKHKKIALIAVILFIPLFAVYMRHGGSFGYNGSIYWKNAARLSQHLLNEAILDDVQALYKASRIHKYTAKINHIKLTAQEVKQNIELLTGAPYEENTLEPFLLKHARGAQNPPRHIFFIMGETYMLWPLLDQYKDLGIANGVKGILAQNNALLISNFLPAANGTMFGLTGAILGMPDISIYTASQPSAAKPYETALSVQLKKLGYETRFFYGGFPSWENVGSFASAQQFDKAYYKADFAGKGNAWGVEDKEFLQGIETLFKDDKPSFNFILTSSNHPPLTVNVDAEKSVKTAADFEKILPPAQAKDKDLINKLRHFEYSDKYIAEFIKTMYQKYPDSIFILTGDHAQRWYVNPNPNIYETVAVPFILFGKGITKPAEQNLSGSHKDIPATVIELAAPKGFEYYSLGQDMLAAPAFGLHNMYWIYGNEMGDISNKDIKITTDGTTPADTQDITARAQALRKIAWWRIMKGTELKD
jgi:phosphoglycerol transferase MdoB-like AlkP superfamily enzyme